MANNFCTYPSKMLDLLTELQTTTRFHTYLLHSSTPDFLLYYTDIILCSIQYPLIRFLASCHLLSIQVAIMHDTDVR